MHTIHLLQKFGDSLGALQIGDVLRKLLQMEGGQSQPTAVLGGKHILCWGLDDTLTRTEKNAAVASSSDREKGKTDDQYKFVLQFYSIIGIPQYFVCRGRDIRSIQIDLVQLL